MDAVPATVPATVPAAFVHHHHAPPAPVIRTVASAVPVAAAHTSHSSTTVHTHEAPAAIRTVSHPVVHAIAHAAEPVAHHVQHVQQVRTVPTPSAVSHSHSTITHETPAHTFIRTAAAPAVPVAFHGAPVAVHHGHAPFVHHAPVVGPVVHAAVAEPAIVRTVLEEPVAVASATAVPRYNYGYSVNDAVSGDSKQRQESRDGDVVTGSYTVADPDGRIRHVEYTADKNGFRATVTYDGEPGPAAIPIAAFAAPTPVQTTVVAAPAPQAQAQVIAARNELPSLPVLPAPAHAVNVASPAQPATTVIRNFLQPAASTHLVHAPVGGVASRIVQTPFASVPNFVNGFPFGATAIPVRQVFPVDNTAEGEEDADATA